MEKLLLDVREAASVLGCRRTFLYGMIQRGELPVIKLGRLTRIPAAALDEYVRGQFNADWRARAPEPSRPRGR
ncbi:MAG: helix-turn-helix domain-containing protein [Candidatus Dormibacteria bacterium]